MARPTVPADTVSQIESLAAYGLSYKEIASRSGVSESTARRYSPAPSETFTSGKKRLLRTIYDHQPVLNVSSLAALARHEWNAPLGEHEVVHLLYSLNKETLVTFTENQRGTGARENDRMIDIRLTPQGERRVEKMKAEAEVAPEVKPEVIEAARKWSGQLTEAGIEPPHSFVVHPNGMVDQWPVLTSLRAQEEATRSERNRAAVLVEAATLLDGIDPEEAERLLARAADIEPSDNPIAAEYLRFAAAHEGATS